MAEPVDHVDIDFSRVPVTYWDDTGVHQGLYNTLFDRSSEAKSLEGVEKLLVKLFVVFSVFYTDLFADEWIHLIMDHRCNSEAARRTAQIFNIVLHSFVAADFPSAVSDWLVRFQDAQSPEEWQQLAETIDGCMTSFLGWVKMISQRTRSPVNIARMRKYRDFMVTFASTLEQQETIPSEQIQALRQDLLAGGAYFHFTAEDRRLISGASRRDLAAWVRYQNDRSASQCSDQYDPFTLQSLNDVPFMFLFHHYENGRSFCFDVIELASIMQEAGLRANPMTGVPFSESTIQHLYSHFDHVYALFKTLHHIIISN